jgi:hypothetical protein
MAKKMNKNSFEISTLHTVLMIYFRRYCCDISNYYCIIFTFFFISHLIIKKKKQFFSLYKADLFSRVPSNWTIGEQLKILFWHFFCIQLHFTTTRKPIATELYLLLRCLHIIVWSCVCFIIKLIKKLEQLLKWTKFSIFNKCLLMIEVTRNTETSRVREIFCFNYNFVAEKKEL